MLVPLGGMVGMDGFCLEGRFEDVGLSLRHWRGDTRSLLSAVRAKGLRKCFFGWLIDACRRVGIVDAKPALGSS